MGDLDAISRLTKFCDEWDKMRMRGDDIHGLHMGEDREAVLRASDIRQAADEIARLRKRLEVVEGWSEDADGIACRNDTIKLQDERIARLREERRGLVEALRAVKDGARVGLPGRPVAKSKWASIPATTYHAVCAMIDAIGEPQP